MNKSTIVFSVAISALLVGCSTIEKEWEEAQQRYEERQVKRREAQEKRFKQLAALPPAQMVAVAPGRDITSSAKYTVKEGKGKKEKVVVVPVDCPKVNALCAKASCDLFNEAHRKMKAYITFYENCRECVGFMNDVQYFVEEEKLSQKDAYEKVAKSVMAADAKLSADEKVWPKIQKGLMAAKTFGSGNEMSQVLALRSRQIEILAALGKVNTALDAMQKELKKAKKNKRISNEAYAQSLSVIQRRVAEHGGVYKQLNLVSECINFMVEQRSRIDDLDKNSR